MSPEFFKTDNKESFKTKMFRRMMNWYPMYFGSGGHILFWSGDSLEVHLRLRLSLWTRNYVGTIYGGSMYAGIDPIYMRMLIKTLGADYIVWDKAAKIRFKRPGKETLFADFFFDGRRIE